jgi:hypothetical protein
MYNLPRTANELTIAKEKIKKHRPIIISGKKENRKRKGIE